MGPKFEEQGAFQGECIVMRGAGEAVQDSLKAVLHEDQAEVVLARGRDR
jgi:hypothetical protein